MAALGSQSIASSYEQLLHVDADGGGNGSTLVNVKDGDNGTTFALQLASDNIKVSGSSDLDGAVTINESSADVDFRVESNADTHAFFVDGGNNRIGIGVSDPDQDIELKRTSANVTLKINAATAANDAQLQFCTGDSADWLIGVDGSETNDPLTFYDYASLSTVLALNNGSVGIGTAAPLGHLHVQESDVNVAPNSSGDNIVIENNGSAGISIISSDASQGYVLFGSASNNAYNYFQSEYNAGSERLRTWVGGTMAMHIGDNGYVGIQELTPSKALDIKNGASGGDILCYDIYTHDGGAETSDERMKENIVDSALGLDFVNALKPRSYKWKDVDEIVEKKTVEKQKTVKVEKEVTRTEIVEEDGKYIQKEITETQEVDEPVFEEVPLYDENGEKLDTLHKIPVMEEVEEIVNQYDAETYTRTHYGMVSQEVKQTMDDLGLSDKDFAGYIYEEDRDKFGLRYTEFISPLIKAIQELSAKVEALEG